LKQGKIKLPEGYRYIKTLKDIGLFVSAHVREMVPWAPAGEDVVLRILNPRLVDEPDTVKEVHAFFETYRNIESLLYLAKVHSLFGGPDGLLFIKQEYVPGKPISEAAPSLRADEAILLLEQVCEALHAAHQSGIHHLLISPDNILYDESARKARLVNFGLACLLRHKSRLPPGFEPYLAPEVRDRGAFGDHSDIYSLAVTIRKLFPHLASHPDIRKAVSPLPDERFSTAREFKGRLRSVFSVETTAAGEEKTAAPGRSIPRLTIYSDPGGASIIVGGKICGTTDDSGLAVPWDKGEITIQKSGYKTATMSYSEPPEDCEIGIVLEPELAPLKLLVKPAGTSVSVDGQAAGITDFEGILLNVPVGVHTIALAKIGYQKTEFPADIGDGRPQKIGPVVLRPGVLNLVTRPSGADVSVAGERVGTTSATGLPVPWSQGPILIEKPGFEPRRLAVQTAPREPTVSVALKRMQPVPSHLLRSILLSVFLFLPTGIVALVHSLRARSRMKRNDSKGAAASARHARVWGWITVGIGSVSWSVLFAAVIVAWLSPHSVSDYGDKARRCLDAGKYETAVNTCNAGLERYPNTGLIYLYRGTAHQKLGMMTRAETDYKKAIQLEPSNPAYQVALGDLYGSIKNYEGASTAYSKAYELAPNRDRREEIRRKMARVEKAGGGRFAANPGEERSGTASGIRPGKWMGNGICFNVSASSSTLVREGGCRIGDFDPIAKDDGKYYSLLLVVPARRSGKDTTLVISSEDPISIVKNQFDAGRGTLRIHGEFQNSTFASGSWDVDEKSPGTSSGVWNASPRQ
jgi:serine/threonine protein kinase